MSKSQTSTIDFLHFHKASRLFRLLSRRTDLAFCSLQVPRWPRGSENGPSCKKVVPDLDILMGSFGRSLLGAKNKPWGGAKAWIRPSRGEDFCFWLLE